VPDENVERVAESLVGLFGKHEKYCLGKCWADEILMGDEAREFLVDLFGELAEAGYVVVKRGPQLTPEQAKAVLNTIRNPQANPTQAELDGVRTLRSLARQGDTQA
jgi:hypothetical protein